MKHEMLPTTMLLERTYTNSDTIPNNQLSIPISKREVEEYKYLKREKKT